MIVEACMSVPALKLPQQSTLLAKGMKSDRPVRPTRGPRSRAQNLGPRAQDPVLGVGEHEARRTAEQGTTWLYTGKPQNEGLTGRSIDRTVVLALGRTTSITRVLAVSTRRTWPFPSVTLVGDRQPRQ